MTFSLPLLCPGIIFYSYHRAWFRAWVKIFKQMQILWDGMRVPGQTKARTWDRGFSRSCLACARFRHVFPRLARIARFPALGTGCTFSQFVTNCAFSCRVWHGSHVIGSLPLLWLARGDTPFYCNNTPVLPRIHQRRCPTNDCTAQVLSRGFCLIRRAKENDVRISKQWKEI